VHVGVIVGSFQARQIDQGMWVAVDGIADGLDQFGSLLRIDGPAHAGVGEHRSDGSLGVFTDLLSAPGLFTERSLFPVARSKPLRRRCFLRLWFRRPPSGWLDGDIEALVSVDHYQSHRRAAQQLQLFIGFDQEAAFPEGMHQP